MKKAILLILFVLFFANNFAQSKIERSKKDLNEGRGYSGSSGGSSSGSDFSLDAEDYSILARLAIYITYYPLVGAYGDEGHLENTVTPYPYYNNFSGTYEKPQQAFFSQKPHVEISNFILTAYDDVYGNHFKIKFRPFRHFALQADYFQLMETDMNDNHFSLPLLNFSFCYDRIRTEKFTLGWTMGANYVGSSVSEAGFSVGFNMEVFPVKPVSLYASVKWGWINGHHVNEHELRFKYHLNRFYVSVGGDFLKIGTPTYNFISAGGGVYF